MRIAMVHKKHDHEKEEPRRYEHGTYYPIGDDETEMRRRSRSAYEDGYADAMRRARMMRDEEDEMRRRSRSYHEEHDEPDMRRRSRSCGSIGEYEEDRRGRRSRSEHDYPMPWYKWGDDEEHRKIGFSAHGGEHEAGHDVHGKASKIIDPRLEAILEEAAKVMENPPHTWEAYLKHKQYDGIVRMEGKELIHALEEGKDAKDVRKELVHTIASLFFLMSK